MWECNPFNLIGAAGAVKINKNHADLTARRGKEKEV